jgi:hypothetical protein
MLLQVFFLKPFKFVHPIVSSIIKGHNRAMEFINKIKQKIEQRRHPIPVEQLEECTCENCGHRFKGRFCPDCGQEVEEFNRPFGFFLYDIFGNFFAFDTRLLKTFKDLIIRPGFISTEFFKGKRVRYSPPVRILVFLSFILFFLLQTLADRTLGRSFDTQTTDNTTLTDSIKEQLPDTLQTTTDSPLASEYSEPDSSSIPISDSESIPITISVTGNLRSSLLKMAEQYETTLKKTQSPEKRKKLMSYIAMCRMPELLGSKILKLLSWAFFALVPIMALILELFYLRQRQRFIKHLIFSSHVHSFMSIVLIIISTLALLFESGIDWIIFALLLSIPVYVFIAMKRFYGQQFKHVFLKFIGLGIFYQFMLMVAAIVVLVRSFGVI